MSYLLIGRSERRPTWHVCAGSFEEPLDPFSMIIGATVMTNGKARTDDDDQYVEVRGVDLRDGRLVGKFARPDGVQEELFTPRP